MSYGASRTIVPNSGRLGATKQSWLIHSVRDESFVSDREHLWLIPRARMQPDKWNRQNGEANQMNRSPDRLNLCLSELKGAGQLKNFIFFFFFFSFYCCIEEWFLVHVRPYARSIFRCWGFEKRMVIWIVLQRRGVWILFHLFSLFNSCHLFIGDYDRGYDLEFLNYPILECFCRGDCEIWNKI